MIARRSHYIALGLITIGTATFSAVGSVWKTWSYFASGTPTFQTHIDLVIANGDIVLGYSKSAPES